MLCTSCAAQDAPPPEPLRISLERMLEKDRYEFVDFPWYSPIEVPIEKLNLTPDDIRIESYEDNRLIYSAEVFLEDINTKAKMSMRNG